MLKDIISLSITFLFFLQTTLQAYPTTQAQELTNPNQILVEQVNVTPHIHNPQDHITLPDNPYGVFVTNSSPTGPLIELNPEYVNYNTYVSSDYILDHLGFSGDTTTRRLGDGMYETQLVRNAMMVRNRGQVIMIT